MSKIKFSKEEARVIVGEIQKGYLMGDLVIRHARVVVSAAPPEETPEETPEEPDDTIDEPDSDKIRRIG